MRKLSFFSTVLTLFLLVPASIIWAQSVSVSGNVYEKGTVKNSYKTPHGTITAILPDDMATEDVISGTVLYEPEGSNERKKRNNLEQLIKYRFFLEDGTPLRAIVNDDRAADLISESPISRSRVTFTIPSMQDQTSLHLILKDGGNQITGESRPPLMDKTLLMMPNFLTFDGIEGDKDKQNRESTPEIQTDKKIYLSGENAAIFLPPVLAKIYMENTIVNSWVSYKGHKESEPVKMDLTTLVGSPRKIVVQIPLNVYGPGEIILEDENKKVIASQKIHVLKLEASCPKTSLLKGEKTVLNVTVNGLKDCPADYLRLNLDNVTSTTVQLGQSNHEELVVNLATHVPEWNENVADIITKINWDNEPQDENTKLAAKNRNIEDAEQFENDKLSLQRSVTALQSGNFTINIGLSYPSSVYSEPFRQQLDALKTVEQFNSWQNALKNDMLCTICSGDHIMTGVVTITSLSPNASSAELDEAKSKAYNVISWPKIGQEVIVAFLGCTLETGKAAVENAIINVGNGPVNVEAIQPALKYAAHQAVISGNKELKTATINSKGDLLKLQKEINSVSQQLLILNNIQKVFNDASKAAVNNIPAGSNTHPTNTLDGKSKAWVPSGNQYGMADYLKIGDLVMSSNISPDRKKEGTDYNFILLPYVELDGIYSLSMSPFLQDWISSFVEGQSLKRNGNFRHVEFNNQPGSILYFKDALITEIEFPKMDVAGKDKTMIGIKIKAEDIKYTSGSEKVKTPDTKEGKQWMPSNFKIELGNLPCKKVYKLENFKITQKTTADMTGDLSQPVRVPEKLEYPNITFFIPESDINPWKEWFNKFHENEKENSENGKIEYLGMDNEKFFSLSLNSIKPVQMTNAGNGNYGITIHPESVMFFGWFDCEDECSPEGFETAGEVVEVAISSSEKSNPDDQANALKNMKWVIRKTELFGATGNEENAFDAAITATMTRGYVVWVKIKFQKCFRNGKCTEWGDVTSGWIKVIDVKGLENSGNNTFTATGGSSLNGDKIEGLTRKQIIQKAIEVGGKIKPKAHVPK